jgi:hypothetical protein
MRQFRIEIFLFLILIFTAQAAWPQDSSKGDKILKRMSEKLSAAQSFSFHTMEFHDSVKRNGERYKINLDREVLVRRPNGFWTKYQGDRDWEFWYDGKFLTGISAANKIYIQHEMPPTLDAAMDMLAARFDMDFPMSDVLYSSPYHAFMDADTKGGLIGKEKMNAASCYHLGYSSSVVNWQLWINETTALPCRLEMTYKKKSHQPFYRITFSNWNLSPKIKEDSFASRIPEDYSRIPILERVLLKRKGPAQTQTAPSEKQ